MSIPPTFDEQFGERRTRALLIVIVLLTLLGSIALMATGARSQGEDLDLKTILRCAAETAEQEATCDRSRDLVVSNCTSCHTFAPIVLQQFDPQSWDSLINRHRGWIPNLSASDFDQIRDYLAANFRPDLDPPELPQSLLDTWTSY